MHLLDTNVVSELRRARPHGGVVAWLAGVPKLSLYIASITFGELQFGVENARRSDPARAAELELWVDDLMAAAQVIAPDANVFRRWAKLMRSRQMHPYEDALIAATALHHGLTVVTRNVKHFEQFGVPLLNPFVGE